MLLAYRNIIRKSFQTYTQYVNKFKCLSRPILRFNTTSTITVEAQAQSSKTHVTKYDKWIGLWLAGCTGMVAGAVILGGVTRLTESGLSMVDWRLVRDMLPPKNEQEWIEEFEKYKQFPEWKYLNKDRNMTLGEFKFIYYMEYTHRMWGRTLGVVFLLPMMYFWRKGCFNKAMKGRMLAFGSLLGFQGFLGWYMVKSGLNEPVKSSDVPRVSHYRLAAHLGSAFLLYSGLLWSSLNYLLKPTTNVGNIATQTLKKAAMRSHQLMSLIFVTAIFGAFVAGLDAGLVYNSFPKMADRWIPTDLLALEPKWRNMFENPTTVQFEHRILGIATLTCICLYAFSLRKMALPPRARLALKSLVAMSFVQVSLGIATLLYYVPTHLAATHQSGSLALLSFAIWLANELKRIPKV